MQYMGGKERISKDISNIINKNIDNTKDFISLFCGSCAVENKIKNYKNIICNDIHYYLIEMYKQLQKGWSPPTDVSKENYEYIKINKDDKPYLTGFVGFCCSYGGRWFRGYAKNKRGDNFAKAGYNSLKKKQNIIKDYIFENKDYRDILINDNSVIYCDPPYNNTEKFGKIPDFNSDDFWEYIRKLSKNNLVFISEYDAPKDFVCIWEKEKKVTINQDSNNKTNIEKLFVHNSIIDKIKY